MRFVFAIIGMAVGLWGCSGAAPSGTISLQFQPAAFVSDEFSLGPTDVTVNGCIIPDQIATIEVRAFSTAITNSSPRAYDIEEVDDNCILSIFLPAGADIELVIKAFDGEQALVRKSIAFIDAFAEGDNVSLPTPLWPATRVDDTTDTDAVPDLQYMEVMRQYDQFLVELAFDQIVFPATRGGSDSLYGFMELVNTETETSYTLLFDARNEGFTLIEAGTTTPEFAEFEFITGGVQIALPYALVGGEANSDEIDAPSIDFRVTVLDQTDAVVDLLPNEDFASFN